MGGGVRWFVRGARLHAQVDAPASQRPACCQHAEVAVQFQYETTAAGGKNVQGVNGKMVDGRPLTVQLWKSNDLRSACLDMPRPMLQA